MSSRVRRSSNVATSDDIWDPDARNPDMRGDWGVNSEVGTGNDAYGGQYVQNEKDREWNVMVVEDKNVANAFAAFRELFKFRCKAATKEKKNLNNCLFLGPQKILWFSLVSCRYAKMKKDWLLYWGMVRTTVTLLVYYSLNASH